MTSSTTNASGSSRGCLQPGTDRVPDRRPFRGWRVVQVMQIVVVVGLISLPVLVGCSGQSSGPAVESGPPTLSSQDELRKRLEYVVSSGMAGSGLAGMPEIIAQLDNAQALEADYRRLEAAGSPDQIKAIAAEMLKKL